MLLTFVLSLIACLINTFLTWFTNALPQVNIPVWSVPSSMTDICAAVNYFLPMNAVWNCLSVLMGWTIFRLVIAVLLRIKSFIPTMGGGA